jgi:hypothetical protein
MDTVRFTVFGVAGLDLADETTYRRLLAALEERHGRFVGDSNICPAGVKVSGAEIGAINIQRHEFHGDRNCTIDPLPDVRCDSS